MKYTHQVQWRCFWYLKSARQAIASSCRPGELVCLKNLLERQLCVHIQHP